MGNSYQLAILAGDGIGPEVMAQALLIAEKISSLYQIEFSIEQALVGGAAIDQHGEPLPAATTTICNNSDAILFGSVGGPKWEHLAPDQQPERGALLPLRKQFQLFANLRPGYCYPELVASSPIKASIIPKGFDVLCVRELTSGIYFGQPKGRKINTEDVAEAFDTMRYDANQISDIAHQAFQAAMIRGNKVTSVDKANVLQCSMLWREVVSTVAKQYPTVTLNHMYVDNAAMQLIANPTQFDVLVTSNLFGDILSDELAMLSGSLGMLPSASLSKTTNRHQLPFGMYEPSGGSAPDIANQNKANPIAQIQSLAMLLIYSLGEEKAGKAIQQAVHNTLRAGARTADIYTGKQGEKLVSTSEMGALIAQEVS